MPRMVWILLLVASPGRVESQAPVELAPGVRIRVHTAGPGGRIHQRAEGTLERIAGDTLVIRPRIGGALPVYVGYPETRLFLFAGRRSSLLRGLAIGSVIGLVAGGAASLVVGNSCVAQRGLCLHRRQFALTGGPLIVLAGATTGLVVGSLSSRDEWIPSRPPSNRIRIRAVPPSGLSLGLQLRF